MKFESLQPMLRTRDLQATITFWTGRLGFTCEEFSPADGWASLRRDEVRVMVAYPLEDFHYGMSEFVNRKLIYTHHGPSGT